MLLTSTGLNKGGKQKYNMIWLSGLRDNRGA